MNINFKTNNIFIGILITLGLIGLSFLITCGLTWLVLFLLAKAGIIVTIKFSWALGLLVWIGLAIFKWVSVKVTEITK